jgi:microcystin-dependent protein
MIYDPIALAWQPLTQSATVAGDNWGTQVVASDPTLSGEGITGSLLKVAQQGATTGQILTWNGSTWQPANVPSTGLSSVAVNTSLSGNGTVGQPLGVNPAGAVNGNVLLFNGTAWGPGQPVFNAFVRGMIIMWSGAINVIPTGWNLCDGTNGTPNLQGQFIVGYNPADGDYNAIGNTGGAKTIALTSANNGPHTHGVNDTGHNHPVSLGTDTKGGSAGVNVLSTQTIKGLYNTNTGTATTGITLQQSGTGTPFDKRPNYYVLAYIMKL